MNRAVDEKRLSENPAGQYILRTRRINLPGQYPEKAELRREIRKRKTRLFRVVLFAEVEQMCNLYTKDALRGQKIKLKPSKSDKMKYC